MKKKSQENSYIYYIVLVACMIAAYYYFSHQNNNPFSQAAGGVVGGGSAPTTALDTFLNSYGNTLGSYVPPAGQGNFSDLNQFVQNNQLSVGGLGSTQRGMPTTGGARYREMSYATALQTIIAQTRFMNEVLIKAGVKESDLMPTANSNRLSPSIVQRADRTRCSFDSAQQILVTQFDNCVANLLSVAISPPGSGNSSRDDVRLACAMSQSLSLGVIDNIIASRCQ